MNRSTAETPLARRFAEALAQTDLGRARIGVESYTAAFLAAEPSLVTSPERRARLAAAIQELVEVGRVRVSRALDRTELPPLPRFILLPGRAVDPAVGMEAAAYPWRPELAWAARLPLRRSEFDALRAIQVFLRDQVTDAAVVPAGERSLELFGDEKRLDNLRRNRRLFAPGRLSMEMLRARSYAPPFAYRRVGVGPVALVLENVTTYHSVLANLPGDSPVGLVVFGAGGNFGASVCYLLELMADGVASAIREIRYFGDLDRRGLEIPVAAGAAAREVGLPAVRPAIGLWSRLLREGRPGPQAPLDAPTAARLVAWLPSSLRAAARDRLISGVRLAQEAVGTKALSRDRKWCTWAELGPPGIELAGNPDPTLRCSSPTFSRPESAPSGEAALVLSDRGEERAPDTETEWHAWTPVRRTRNWILGDPILDWLDLYGERAGFIPDDQRPTHDPRTDFRRLVLEKAAAFASGVMRLLEQRVPIVRVAESPEDARSLAKARATFAALRSGAPAVAQAVLRNPERRTFGTVDLLVRSDILANWFPELLADGEAATPAPGLGLSRLHYRVVDVKFRILELTSDGHLVPSVEQLPYAAQVWLHTEALGRLQGWTPPAGYLIGRTWEDGDLRGEGCLERLARVDLDRWLPHREVALERIVADSVEWGRRLAIEGGNWQVLPEPSVPELYPHARNLDDAPWHLAKREIAATLGELTLLPGVNPTKRATALAAGIRSWRDETLSAARLGITAPALAARTDAVLAANRAPEPTLLPERILADPLWRSPGPVELYVDFETVSNLDDDFAALPRLGGHALIVLIGCGHVAADGVWRFDQWVVDTLSAAEEERIVGQWINHMLGICAAAGTPFEEARLFHWSAAEPADLAAAYRSAQRRHQKPDWPNLPWFDLLDRIVRAEPVAVTGAFSFGLKAMAKAMHAAGYISTIWSDGPTDGLGAMVGTWSAEREAAEAGTPLSAHPLMVEIARYNEIDCRVMCEILIWLRKHR
jgi:hypothetical protein